MEPAGVRVPLLVPPMKFQTTRPTTATGQPSFHFVDEAAPPRALKALAGAGH